MIIEDIITYRVAKLKAVKLYSDKKSLPNWKIPVVHALMLGLVVSIYGAKWVINPYLEGILPNEVLAFMPLILLFGIFMTILDQIAKVMVWVNWAFIQLVMKSISKIDYHIWRKYKKEDFVANKIWKVQVKFQMLGKVNRRRLFALLIIGMVFWMTYRIIW